MEGIGSNGWHDRSNCPAGKTGEILTSCKMQMGVQSHFDILAFFLNKDNLIFVCKWSFKLLFFIYIL